MIRPEGDSGRSGRRWAKVLAMVVAIAVATAVLVVAFRDAPARPTVSDEIAPPPTSSTTSTPSTEATTTTTVLERFVSDRGWSLQPGPGWVASSDEADGDLVVWVTSSGTLVTVQTVENDEGFVVTPASVRDGLPEYVSDAFDLDGDVETEDAELDGRWAVRGVVEAEGRTVIVSVGSPDRTTFIVSMYGRTEQVEAEREIFEQAVADFSYG